MADPELQIIISVLEEGILMDTYLLLCIMYCLAIYVLITAYCIVTLPIKP